MNKMIGLFLLVFFIFPQHLRAADVIVKGDLLTLEQCIGIALKNHPALSASAGAMRASESRIGQARAGYYPQITFQSSYTRAAPVATPLQNDPFNFYSNTLSLNQTLFDFGKTGTLVDITKLNTQTTQANYQETASLVVLGVKEAYYAVLKARMSEKVALETVDQFQKHYDVAKTFFETGRSSKIDVTSADVNLTNSRIQLLSAQNALRIARANLNVTMGLTSAPDYDIREDFQPGPVAISFETALKQAYENRPEILSATYQAGALEKNVELIRKDYLPVLSGNAAYSYSGEQTPLDRSWSVGLILTFPLFSGLSTTYAIKEAKANLDVAQFNNESLRHQVYREVQAAYLNRQEAYERIDAGKTIVYQAEETLELARGRYATGVGNSIEITDALIGLNNAKMTLINALSDFSIAEASLEKAIGVKK